LNVWNASTPVWVAIAIGLYSDLVFTLMDAEMPRFLYQEWNRTYIESSEMRAN
jgi:hypothetical protein